MSTIREILYEKRKTTEDHIAQLQKEGKQGVRYTAMMPDVPFLVLGLLSDIGWLAHLIAGIVYFCRNGFHHAPDYIALIALAAVVFGVAYIIYLNKIHEKEIATRLQKDLGFGVTVYPEQESLFLERKAESPKEVELLALVDGKVVGTAGIDAVGTSYKVAHRADFGVSVAKEYWGHGIGRALMEACIKCARDAGYVQLELSVVADNERAVAMYKKAGFVEYGRNPKGFNSRLAGFQELIYMRLEL